MDLTSTRNELSRRGKNGNGFMLSALVIWTIITILFSSKIPIGQKNIFMLYATGLMFPLSVMFSSLLRADWKFKDIPLGALGIYLNLAQIVYFPILIWAMIKSPSDAVMIFAMITGAHLFPYGWLYRSMAYYVMAPVISVWLLILSLCLKGDELWLTPFSLVISLVVILIWNGIDERKKRKK